MNTVNEILHAKWRLGIFSRRFSVPPVLPVVLIPEIRHIFQAKTKRESKSSNVGTLFLLM